MARRESEFGRGYATCLFQFVMHAPRLDDFAETSKAAHARNPALFANPESDGIEMWASGASDHLYELITGGRINRLDRATAKMVASMAISCGHGYMLHNWTRAMALNWLECAVELLVNVGNPLTLDEAMAIDRHLGLRPERGTYSCSTVLRTLEEIGAERTK